MAYSTGRLTRNFVRSLGPGRHGDGNGLYLGSGLLISGLRCISRFENER